MVILGWRDSGLVCFVIICESSKYSTRSLEWHGYLENTWIQTENKRRKAGDKTVRSAEHSVEPGHLVSSRDATEGNFLPNVGPGTGRNRKKQPFILEETQSSFFQTRRAGEADFYTVPHCHLMSRETERAGFGHKFLPVLYFFEKAAQTVCEAFKLIKVT